MATKFDKVRLEMMDKVREMFANADYDVLRTGSQELCVPIIGEGDEEGYLVLTFKIPKGSRDGDAYDGYAMAQDYERKVEERKAKAQEAKAKKEAKAKHDAERRAKQAQEKEKG